MAVSFFRMCHCSRGTPFLIILIVLVCVLLREIRVKQSVSEATLRNFALSLRDKDGGRQDLKEGSSAGVRTLLKTHPDVHVFHTDISYDHSCVPYRPTLQGQGVLDLKLCLYNETADSGISRIVRKTQAWEPELVSNMAHALKMNDQKAVSDRQDRLSLVDIGCNIGTFTVVAAALGYDVLAVDAMKESLQLLDTSLRINSLRSRVTIVHNALSEKYEQVAVGYCTGCGPGSTRVAAYRSGSLEAGHTVLNAVLFDDLIPLLSSRRVLIKIDIEAAEARALRGAATFFDKVNVVGVLMEWVHVKRNKRDRDFLIGFLSKNGFWAYPSPTNTTVLNTEDSISWPKDIYWHKK